jgi:hypothetical protein
MYQEDPGKDLFQRYQPEIVNTSDQFPELKNLSKEKISCSVLY